MAPTLHLPRTSGLRIRALAVLVGISLVVLAVVAATRAPQGSQTAQSPLLFKPAPQLSGPTVDGARASLSAMKGRFVLVNFYASWCAACHTFEPQLVRFLSDNPGNVAILGVDISDETTAARAFMARYGARWPAIEDPNGQIGISWGVSEPPESFLVAPNGEVITKIIGSISANRLDALVQIALVRGY